MKFKVGDIANGIETSEEIIDVPDYISALEQVLEIANIYVYPYDTAAKLCKEKVNHFKKIIKNGKK